MEVAKKLNDQIQFTKFFEKVELQQILQNSIQIQDFQHPTFSEQLVLEELYATPEYKAKLEKKKLKQEKKLKKERKASQQDEENQPEEEEEKEKQIEQEVEDEEVSEERKQARQYIIQDGFQSGKTTAMLLAQLNDFIPKVLNFDITQLQKDQDEATHGLFSIVLCSSKDNCQKASNIAENLIMKFKKQIKSKISGQSLDIPELSQKEKNTKANIIIYNLSKLQKDQSPSIMPNKHYVIVATPSQFLKFAKTLKIEQKYYVNFGLDDLDYMLSFGYDQDIDNFQFHFQNELQKNLVMITLGSEIKEDLKECQQKLVPYAKIIQHNFQKQIENEENEEENKKTIQTFERDYRVVSQFYYIGDEVSKYINLYIMYKLQFLSGKTLIICPDQSSVYKMFLFLQRIGAKGFQVLNDTDPKNLRYYVMSMFNTGVIQTMITTEKVFEDLRKKVFYTKKRKILQFKNLGNIIFMDLKNVKDIYNNMYTHFRGSEGTIISLLDQSELQVEILTNLIEQQKKQFTQINIKEFPLKKHEIDSFRYRISDVVGAISRKQVKNMQMLDFKKKLLKSKELETYFRENDADRQLIIEDINSLSKQIHQYQVKCEDEIPEYLVPEMVKEQRKRFNDKKEKFSKIQVSRTNEEFQKSLKRRMEKNNLTLDDVKKKKVLDQAGDKFVVVNNEKEAVDGDEVDANRLKVISGRKLWKIKHGFKLHKKNKRMEKKGIYQA